MYVTHYNPYSGVTKRAAETILAGQVLYETTSGTFGLADADASGKKRPVGIAFQDAASGDPVTAYSDCEVEGFTSLTVGDNVYLSTTAGGITATLPSSGQLCVLGTALSATKARFSIKPAAIALQASGNSDADVA